MDLKQIKQIKPREHNVLYPVWWGEGKRWRTSGAVKEALPKWHTKQFHHYSGTVSR